MRISPSTTLRRVLAASSAIALAALIAAGCGGSDTSAGAGDTGLVGDQGPLAWLPSDTWLVATANLDPETIDTAVQSLDRLPIWALAEGFLPASDGTGLRRELLEQVAKSRNEANGDKDATSKVTAKELETAFGERVGFAITSADFAKMDGDDAPYVAWVEVDDEEAAVATAKDMFAGSETKAEHESVTYYESKKDDATFLVRDDLLVVSSSPKRLEQLIDVRDGDDSLAGDDVAAAVLEVGVGDALVGFAVQSTPLLEAAPDLVRDEADNIDEDGEASADSKKNAEQAAKIADELGPVLKSDAVDGLIADWVGGSMTIDESGLRIKGAWSNPHDLATPDPSARELVERMPADAPIVTGAVNDGTTLARVQAAWTEVRDAYDLDLRAMVDADCPPADRWACDLGVEAALALLEDEDLANALADQGDSAFVMTQDLAPLMASLAGMSDPTAPKAAPKPLDARLYEVATTAGMVKHAPPAELVSAARAAGLVVTTDAEGLSVTVRVTPGSPLARTIAAEVDPQSAAALAAFGFDVRALLTPKGLTLTAEEVDGLLVAGFPQGAPSKVVPALEGDADTLDDAQTYQDVVKAAKPPKQVGSYGFVDLKSYVEAILAGVGQGQPDVQRIIPTVRNNLADVPGILTWSAREESDGEEVGVVEMSMPILE